jgi:HAD superfamily hydrolase (TIGR01549 family)
MLSAPRGSDAPAGTVLHVGGSDLGRIGAVLLDVDGTLYRQRPVKLTMAAEMVAVPLTKGSIRQLRRLLGIIREFRRVREELRHLGAGDEPLERLQYLETARRIGASARDVEDAVAEWMFQRPLKHLRRWKSSGVDAFLDAARRRGVVIGALSDYPVADKLAALGVAHYFSLALCTTDRQINAFKPHPRGFLEACGTWGLSPSEVLYVGDRPDVDASGARAAGMPCAIVGGFSRSRGGSDAIEHIGIRSFVDLAAGLAVV